MEYTVDKTKKALELVVNGVGGATKKLCKAALDAIIQQEAALAESKAQIAELENDLDAICGLRNNRKYYRKFIDEVFRKQKGKELSEPDFDYIYRLYFEQQEEIERLRTIFGKRKVAEERGS